MSSAQEIFEENLTHFKVISRNDNQVIGICPAHVDKEASLSIAKGQKCTLFRCHAGCRCEDILQAAGIAIEDTFYYTKPQRTNWRTFVESREKRRIIAVYDYHFFNGKYAFTKIRLEGKKLLYGILENERFLYGLRNIHRKSLKAVYGDLQALNREISCGEPIYIVEGEKDVDTLTKQGYTAFTYGGVNDWQEDFAELVKGADVIILADNDEAGKRVAETIQNDINEVANSSKIIVPMPDIPKADISDFFESGHSRQEFDQMIDNIKSTNKFNKGINLDRFHFKNDAGKITGVIHYEIFEDIKSKNNIFVCGSTPYIYENGYYVADYSGAKLKTLIMGYIYKEFIKSQTINNIYNLFLQDVTLEKTFEELNQFPPHWICFTNGMWDCKSKRLIQHNPKYLCINQIPHRFDGTVKHGNKIDRFLDFICDHADDREMLLQFIGYCLTRDTSQQKFLVLCGCGGSGKSTLIRLIECMVGKRNISNVALGELSHRFASFGLLGKLMNSCADLEISALEDTSIIKKLLGEDTIRGEQKGKDGISFNSYAKLVFSTNELPLVKSEKSNGFYRRLLVLTMDKKPAVKNPHLYLELESEIEYLIYISVQALEKMYQHELVTVSENSEKAVNQLWADSDTVQAFISECCILSDSEKSERGFLFSKYKDYCEETERVSLTKNNFYKSLRIKGCKDFKTNGERFFRGISYGINSPKGQNEYALDAFVSVSDDEISGIKFG